MTCRQKLNACMYNKRMKTIICSDVFQLIIDYLNYGDQKNVIATFPEYELFHTEAKIYNHYFFYHNRIDTIKRLCIVPGRETIIISLAGFDELEELQMISEDKDKFYNAYIKGNLVIVLGYLQSSDLEVFNAHTHPLKKLYIDNVCINISGHEYIEEVTIINETLKTDARVNKFRGLGRYSARYKDDTGISKYEEGNGMYPRKTIIRDK